MRESTHPVAQVGRDLGIPDNVLYPWISQHLQAEAHGTTRAYDLNVERGCREGCILEDWRERIGMMRRSHGLRENVV